MTAGQSWGRCEETPGLTAAVGAIAAPAGAQSRRPARQGDVLSDVLTYMDGVGQPSLGSPWHYGSTVLCLASLILFYSGRHLFSLRFPSTWMGKVKSHSQSWWLTLSPSAQPV